MFCIKSSSSKVLIALSVVIFLFAVAAGVHGKDRQQYAGQEQREIKALAAETIQGLTAGAGLGYAKAAELNGWPGPLHALELSKELALSEEQIAQLQSLREAMLAQAIPLGKALVEAERELDQLFATATPTAAMVTAATAQVAAIEGQLRAVHLNTHIITKPVLSRHQQMLYRQARGYGSGDHSTHSHGH